MRRLLLVLQALTLNNSNLLKKSSLRNLKLHSSQRIRLVISTQNVEFSATFSSFLRLYGSSKGTEQKQDYIVFYIFNVFQTYFSLNPVNILAYFLAKGMLFCLLSVKSFSQHAPIRWPIELFSLGGLFS